MPAEVIDRVHVIAHHNNCAIGLAIMDCTGTAILDADLSDAPDDKSYNDDNYNPADDDSTDTDTDTDTDTSEKAHMWFVTSQCDKPHKNVSRTIGP
jgi:hypothetical protein